MVVETQVLAAIVESGPWPRVQIRRKTVSDGRKGSLWVTFTKVRPAPCACIGPIQGLHYQALMFLVIIPPPLVYHQGRRTFPYCRTC